MSKKEEGKPVWEFSVGLYPGLLIGMRSYPEEDRTHHVLYIPLIDFCFTTYE